MFNVRGVVYKIEPNDSERFEDSMTFDVDYGYQAENRFEQYWIDKSSKGCEYFVISTSVMEVYDD